MANYSTFTLDGLNLVFDPDSVNVSVQNLIAVNKSMGGTTYLTSYDYGIAYNGYMKTISLQGTYLPSAAASTLISKSAKKTPVVMANGPLGTSGYYVISSVSINPLKPGMHLDSDSTVSDIKYQYSITLQEVN